MATQSQFLNQPEADLSVTLTVSEFSQRLQKNLEESFSYLWITGELSGVFVAQSGHLYATIKDQQSQLKIVMYHHVREKLIFKVEEGLKVRVLITASIYKPRGELQLLIKMMEPDGQGPLKLAFEQLKSKLAAEGLFSPHHKLKIPIYPRSIGLITSKGGAVLHDMMRVILRRYPVVNIIIYETAVQGKEAAMQIIAALRKAEEEKSCDVYIVARGGGSLEDLWCFNEESVVRAIAAFKYPIISAIGHETDFTLTDYAADLRAPTPSIAAELAVPDLNDLVYKIDSLHHRMAHSLMNSLKTLEQRMDYVLKFLRNPQTVIERFHLMLKTYNQRLTLSREKYFEKIHTSMNRSKIQILKSLYRLDQQQTNFQRKLDQDSLKAFLCISDQFKYFEQQLDLINFRFVHLDPEKITKNKISIKTAKEGVVLSSAKAIEPKTRAYLQFFDGSWEIEFIKEIN